MKYQNYAEYKDSGVEWLGDIPDHWIVVRLKNILQCRITDGPHTTPVFVDEGVPFLSVDGIQDGELKFDRCRYISEINHAEYRMKALPKRNDLLIGKAASTGKIARVKVDFEFSIWSPLALIRLDCTESNPTFFEQSLKSPIVQAQIENLCTANTQKNISMDDIPKLILTRPPLEEQTKIANFLDHETAKIDTLIEKQQQLIKLLKEKRQAVISHAVTKGLNPNATMRDSGVEWLGEVPKHWLVSKVKFFSTMQGGYAFSSDAYQDDGIQLLRIGNVYLNRLALERQPTFVDNNFVKSHNEFVVRFGDLLMSLTGILGKTDYGYAISVDMEGPFMLNQRVAKIHPNENKIMSDYLLYSIRSEPYLRRLYSLPSGTKQANLSNDDVLNIPIAVPPDKTEQNEITSYVSDSLKKYEELIGKCLSVIELMQERRTALISAAVTGKIDVRSWQAPKPVHKPKEIHKEEAS